MTRNNGVSIPPQRFKDGTQTRVFNFYGDCAMSFLILDTKTPKTLTLFDSTI